MFFPKKPENKTFEANKSPKQFKEEIPKLKFAEKRNIPKVRYLNIILNEMDIFYLSLSLNTANKINRTL